MTFSEAYQLSKLFETLNKLEICEDEFYIARLSDDYHGVFQSVSMAMALHFEILDERDNVRWWRTK